MNVPTANIVDAPVLLRSRIGSAVTQWLLSGVLAAGVGTADVPLCYLSGAFTRYPSSLHS